MNSGVRLVEVVRNGIIECVHTGHAVTLGADGRTISTLGDPGRQMLPRSCAKPAQAFGMRRLGFTGPPEWLALSAASHSAEPAHLDVVRAMLAAGGLTEDDLECPPSPTRLQMNCSGKHAAMLLTCRAQDWPTVRYTDPDHPLQLALRSTIAELTGEPVSAVAVDGCGAPLFATTLTGLARAFRAVAGSDVAAAFRAHPVLAGGTGRSVTRLMTGVPGLLAKDGAEGVYAAALPDGGAVAVKIDDGAMRAAECAVAQLLRRAGLVAAVLDELTSVAVLGATEPVGVIRPAF